MTRRRPPRLSDQDLTLWRTVTRDVDPLIRMAPPSQKKADAPAPGAPGADDPETGAPAAAPKPSRKARARPAAAPPPAPRPPPPPPRLAPGIAAGVDRRTADRLRRGRLTVDARLDLHGMTQHAAHEALIRFVLDGHARGRRTLLVITGKGTFGDGRGILRARVPDWLNDAPLRDKVLAIETAQPRDGGTGALYVLLKRRRDG
jgi:DNA-nicking Smr family endonuclease